MQRLHALLAEAGDGDGGGDGAPAGGSPEGGQGKPEDEKAKFEARIRSALADQERRLNAEFEARLEAHTKAKPAEAPKRYTRSQLQAAVTSGEITQEQADAQIESQVHSDAEERAHRVALNTVSAAERKRLVDSQIARYKAVAPEILDDTHEARQRIREEFNNLVSLGDDPRDVATQLKAIRAHLGPIEKLERARSGRFQAEHHQETGGGGGGQQKQKTGKLVDQLNAESKRHYEKGIEQGRYKDWAAVEDELKFATPKGRQRLGIAA